MHIPENLKYTSDHEWVMIENDRAKVGITDYAQDALGDVVFVDIPEVGKRVTVGETVTGSLSGVAGVVVSWNSATKTLVVDNPTPNAGNYLWNKNENITGGSTGAQGVIQFIFYPSYIRNEPD